MIFLQAGTYIRPVHFYAVVTLFSGLILALIIGMVFILIRKNRHTVRQKQLHLQFKDWLVGIILEEPDEHHPGFEVPDHLRAVLQKSFARQQLLQELKQLKNSLSGLPSENLGRLYNQLGLAEHSVRDLRSRRWYRIAKGIQELAAMNQVGFAAKIFSFTNHRHQVVRMEAQIGLVCLQHYEGLRFFESLVYPLTEWHQVKLLQLLANQPIPSKDVILPWLQSPNTSVVQFTLKLIGEQHAANFQQEVMACLSHPEKIIRRQAIASLGEIPSAPAAEALRQLFYREQDKNLKMDILAVLLRTGTAEEVPFLQLQLQAMDDDIRLAAGKALFHLKSQAAA